MLKNTKSKLCQGFWNGPIAVLGDGISELSNVYWKCQDAIAVRCIDLISCTKDITTKKRD